MEKALMKYKCTFNDEPSWGLVAVGKTPIVAGYYDPKNKVLALLSKPAKDEFMMVQSLGNSGEPLLTSSHSESAGTPLLERTLAPKYTEHYLSDEEDINFFLTQFVMNNFKSE